MLIVTGGH